MQTTIQEQIKKLKKKSQNTTNEKLKQEINNRIDILTKKSIVNK